MVDNAAEILAVGLTPPGDRLLWWKTNSKTPSMEKFWGEIKIWHQFFAIS
ncbi:MULTISPECIES: hypothetical protein [Synechocystis]|uniref:Transposase n=1 Tax=Synechocystis salina LEGE 00031 TaxID=1828736 RepID=A0ABR9VQK9_9SYNC|nr:MULTISPECIES: hypothetical protein [Synechocystis]MBD2653843.1 hypothetical protein [Synechocystis sp. FACHB-383]MBE9240034.1 hypothetical protein [Synechocystis salina LEGE 00041]MBE9252546.1 hypothetical protein [Synechocystis salina LEGE 00031]